MGLDLFFIGSGQHGLGCSRQIKEEESRSWAGLAWKLPKLRLASNLN